MKELGTEDHVCQHFVSIFQYAGTSIIVPSEKEGLGARRNSRFYSILPVLFPRGVLVSLKFQVNSQKFGVQVPQNFEFE